jgi:hypothetical protein
MKAVERLRSSRAYQDIIDSAGDYTWEEFLEIAESMENGLNGCANLDCSRLSVKELDAIGACMPIETDYLPKYLFSLGELCHQNTKFYNRYEGYFIYGNNVYLNGVKQVRGVDFR